MNALSNASLIILFYAACFSSASLANGTLTAPANGDENFVTASTGAIFTPEMRSTLKREVMSKPGVFLDMANLTDNGYSWTNDVVWVGSNATANDAGAVKNEQWYIAGFMFQRPRYKGVWLQYAFTLSDYTGEIVNFRRWYGDAIFR